MEITKVFRGLVATLLVLFAVGAAISIFEPELPDEVNAYLEGDGAGPLFSNLDSRPMLAAVIAGFAVAYLASCIGLLMFQRWARTTFIVCIAVGIVVTPWQGASLSSPLISMVETLYSMIDGALLVMLLFDPIKAKFAKRSASA